MGKILNGILGGVSGKVAGVVGANWKGIDYLKGYSIPANPNTAAQQAQRSKMRFAIQTAVLILSAVIHNFWDPFVTKMSGYNDYIKSNLNSLTAADDWANLITGKGNLEAPQSLTAAYNSVDHTVGLGWPTSTSGNGAGTDSAMIVIFDSANNVVFTDDSKTRADGSAIVDMGVDRTPADLKAYLFFHRGTGSDLEVSNSVFAQVA